MKKIFSITLGFVFAGFAFTGCTGDTAVERANTNVSLNGNLANIKVVDANKIPSTNAPNVNISNINTGDMASDPKSFMTTAAEDGMFEVQAGKLASAKTQDAAVKQYGQEMVSDHTRAVNELKQLAQSENVTLPNDVSAEQKQKLDRLQGLSGAEFDREYMTMMVDAHQKAVNLFQNQANKGDDPEVKAFAAKTLPTLQEHLKDAQSLSGKMK